MERCFENLTRDVFIYSAGFFEKIYYTFAQEPDKLFWARLKEKDFCISGKLIGTLEEYRNFVCSSSKNFDCFSRSGVKNVQGMDPVFLQ